MDNLKTNYLGLTLKSPVIIGSSRLTSNPENLELAEESGAGAVVLKSLFEEQITHHVDSLSVNSGYPEADDYIAGYLMSHSVDQYVELVKTAKRNLAIPVIASINCYSAGGWVDFASRLTDSGADALEINVFLMPVDRKKSAYDYEMAYMDIIEKMMKVISVPVSIKIGPRFTNILYAIDQFYMRGVKGVVMFNRFYEPDIDVNKLEVIPAPIFSTPAERRYVLRWIAMASAQDFKIDIAASTGVHNGEDAVRYMLAGASAIQVCSILYQKGIAYARVLNEEISGWMKLHDFKNIDDFRGRLNWSQYKNPSLFERAQFMKHFASGD